MFCDSTAGIGFFPRAINVIKRKTTTTIDCILIICVRMFFYFKSFLIGLQNIAKSLNFALT